MHDTDAFPLFGSSSIVLATQMTDSNLVLDQPIIIFATVFFLFCLGTMNTAQSTIDTRKIVATISCIYKTAAMVAKNNERGLPITIVMVYSKLFCPGLPLVPQY